MNTLRLNVRGFSDSRASINIDGEPVKLKRNEFESYDVTYTTEKSEVEITVYKYLEVRARLWFIIGIISFILGVFGIFEPRYDRGCCVIDFKLKVRLKEQSKVSIGFDIPGKRNKNAPEEGSAAEIKTDCEYELIDNRYHVDKIAKKRLRILLITKILIWLALIAAGIIIVISIL